MPCDTGFLLKRDNHFGCTASPQTKNPDFQGFDSVILRGGIAVHRAFTRSSDSESLGL